MVPQGLPEPREGLVLKVPSALQERPASLGQ